MLEEIASEPESQTSNCGVKQVSTQSLIVLYKKVCLFLKSYLKHTTKRAKLIVYIWLSKNYLKIARYEARCLQSAASVCAVQWHACRAWEQRVLCLVTWHVYILTICSVNTREANTNVGHRLLYNWFMKSHRM